MWCTELQTGSEAPITKAFLYEARLRFFAKASLGMLASAILGVAASTRPASQGLASFAAVSVGVVPWSNAQCLGL